jgi:hypothetical protein
MGEMKRMELVVVGWIGAILIGLIVPTGKGKKWYLRGVFLAPVISLVWITALFLATAVWRW